MLSYFIIYHKINPNRGGTYIDFPDWIKYKKATINPIIKKEHCFEYSVTVALSHIIKRNNVQTSQ